MGTFKPRVLVLTSDKYLWAIRPFAYLFNIYWSSLQPVEVVGFRRPDFNLPKNFRFHSISDQNFPAGQWSNQLANALALIPDEILIIMLEDYWLTRTVDVSGVQRCVEYMEQNSNVLRFDLTDDRQYAGGAENIGSYGHYDIIETPAGTPYQVSLQAALWRRSLLNKIIVPKKSAWEFEIHTSPPPELRVLGTRQCPVRYANAMEKGEINLKQIHKIPQEHIGAVRDMIPKGTVKE